MPGNNTSARVRFRLRHLLIATAVVSFGLGYPFVRVRQYAYKSGKVQELLQLCAAASPHWRIEIAGDLPTSPPVQIDSIRSIYNRELYTTANFLRGDFSFLDLHHVALQSTDRRAAEFRKALKYLTNFSELSELEISSNWFTDDDLAELVHMCPSIIYLKLASDNVTDASLAHIGQLNQLQKLNLYSTNVTGEALGQVFDACPDLWELTLWDYNITPAARKVVERWQQQRGYKMRTFDNSSLTVIDPNRF